MNKITQGLAIAAVAVALTGCENERQDLEAWCHGGEARVVEICVEEDNDCGGKYPDLAWRCVIVVERGAER